MSKPHVEIHYCIGCKWMIRATWMAQELLSTFSSALGGVAICPSEVGGTFDILIDGQQVWSRAESGRFPEIKELKRLVRDRIDPERDLGHIEEIRE